MRMSLGTALFNVVLLILHYAFWLFYCVSLLGLASSRTSLWGLWDYLVFVYPTLGLAYSLTWAKDSKNRSSWRYQAISPTTAPGLPG